ncbi:MAG: hypothetical protein AB3N16_05385 [Flavobacteriaceae bacterium]
MTAPENHTLFMQALSLESPPRNWSQPLRALWYDANGDWESAHNIAQDLHTPMGSWIHAYLHRKEGDDWNAGYWYRRAGRSFFQASLEDEFNALVKAGIASG